MPYSSEENRQFVLDTVKQIQPDSILDVGAGSGTYSDLLRTEVDHNRFDAVEVWTPYVQRFGLDVKYDTVYVTDIRKFYLFHYDLVIFGDVLEHMTLNEAKTVWGRVAEQASWGMISVPIIHYPQGAYEDNPFEAHVQEHLTPEVMERNFGPFDESMVFDVTATFFKNFGET